MLNNMNENNFEKINRDYPESDNEQLESAMAGQLYTDENPITNLQERKMFSGIPGIKSIKMKPEEEKLLEDFNRKTRYQDPTQN